MKKNELMMKREEKAKEQAGRIKAKVSLPSISSLFFSLSKPYHCITGFDDLALVAKNVYSVISTLIKMQESGPKKTDALMIEKLDEKLCEQIRILNKKSFSNIDADHLYLQIAACNIFMSFNYTNHSKKTYLEGIAYLLKVGVPKNAAIEFVWYHAAAVTEHITLTKKYEKAVFDSLYETVIFFHGDYQKISDKEFKNKTRACLDIILAKLLNLAGKLSKSGFYFSGEYIDIFKNIEKLFTGMLTYPLDATIVQYRHNYHIKKYVITHQILKKI